MRFDVQPKIIIERISQPEIDVGSRDCSGQPENTCDTHAEEWDAIKEFSCMPDSCQGPYDENSTSEYRTDNECCFKPVGSFLNYVYRVSLRLNEEDSVRRKQLIGYDYYRVKVIVSVSRSTICDNGLWTNIQIIALAIVP
jgi:hypothetical protein